MAVARAPSDVRYLEWSGKDDFPRVRAEWLEAVRWDTKLLPVAKLVIQEIAAKFGHDRSDAWPSIPYLAAALDTSEPTVKRAIASAIERGVLICEKRGFGGANHYFMAVSRQVQNEVMADYERRMIHFGETRRPSMRSPMIPLAECSNEITDDPSMRSPMISHSDHPRSLNEITDDPLSLSSNPISEPGHRSLSQGLSEETVQDEALGDLTVSISDLHGLLGEGDQVVGARRAARLSKGRLAYLAEQIELEGIVGAATDIQSAIRLAVTLESKSKTKVSP